MELYCMYLFYVFASFWKWIKLLPWQEATWEHTTTWLWHWLCLWLMGTLVVVFYHHRQDCYVNISTLVWGSVPLGYILRRGTAGSKDVYTFSFTMMMLSCFPTLLYISIYTSINSHFRAPVAPTFLPTGRLKFENVCQLINIMVSNYNVNSSLYNYPIQDVNSVKAGVITLAQTS